MLVTEDFALRFSHKPSGASRGGVRGTRTPPLFWVKKEEMTEGRKAGRASKTKLLPPLLPLSSKSGSATEAEAFDC